MNYVRYFCGCNLPYAKKPVEFCPQHGDAIKLTEVAPKPEPSPEAPKKKAAPKKKK